MAYVNIPASTGNISINVPSSQGRININTVSKSDTTNVSLQDVQSFAVNKAKDWAEKMDGPIGNEGYSAKWHATEAQGHAEQAREYSTGIIDLKDSMLQELISIKEEVIENENITIIGENIEDINITAENIEAIKDTAVLLEHVEKKSMPVGTIYQAIRTDIPEGSLRLDGTEFTTGFESFVTNYLATGKIISKSLAEWQTEYTMTNGNVGFFGYDSTTGKFKTPCIQTGTFLAQAITSGDFGSFLASSLKSHTHTQNAHTHSWSGTTSSTGAHTHTRGTMNITGSAGMGESTSATGAFTYAGGSAASGNTQTGGSTDSGFTFDASKSWTGSTSSNGAHTHTISGTTGSATPTINATGGSDTYPKHIRYPFFVVVSNVNAEEPSQADWDNFVGNLDNKLNKSLSNIDEIGQAKFNAKLNKSGGTMTGSLTMNASLNLKGANNDIDYTSTTAPSSALNGGWLYFRDKNGQVSGQLYNQHATNNAIRTCLSARRDINGTVYTSEISVLVDTNGTTYFDFPKCTTKATTTSSAKQTKVAVVVQNYVNGTSWYRVWSDGWIEQGGYITRGSATNGTVTLLKAFSNTNYTITMAGHTCNVYWQLNWHDKSTGSFSWAYTGGTDGNSTGGNWYACGY